MGRSLTARSYPLIPAVALLGAAVLLLSPSGAAAQARREQALSLTNEARQEAALGPLVLDRNLVAAAKAHAGDMLSRDYYAHESPEGETVRDRFLAEGGGKWRQVAENIALCRGCPVPPGPDRVRAFHEGWMESPEHRENILDPGLEEFGFAMTWEGETIYAVQTFAGPGRPQGLSPSEAEQELPPDLLAEEASAAVNAAREAEGRAPLEPSAALDAAAARLTEAGVVRDGEDALREALPANRGNRVSVGMVSGECGGCGTVPTAADARHFVQAWLQDGALAETLLSPEARTLGFAVTASGAGRKGAVALIGKTGGS